MKIFKYDIDLNSYYPEYLNKNISFAFLDIETDGFNSVKNNIVLIGLYIVTEESSNIIQLFSDRGRDDERKILTEFTKIIKNIDFIYTYNGATFDIPFLSKKFKYYNIYNPIDDIAHIDLIKIIRSNKKVLRLDNCKLKTVENYIGISREDSISGKDSVLLYKKYLKNKSPAIEKTILKHNYDDIFYLSKVLEFEDNLRDKYNNSMILGIDNDEYDNLNFFEIISIRANDSNIVLKGNVLNRLKEHNIYGNSYNLNIDSKNKNFELIIFTENCQIGSDRIAKFIDLNSDNLLDYNIIKYKDDCNAKIPDNLLLLEFNQEILVDNIKNLLRNILKR
ncbi:MAG: ribonuclease H-like domain-containing protein [Andreesenia angusta]|nr:ribonuclease H-like domain-containing protein [Andreesenia angusta]